MLFSQGEMGLTFAPPAVISAAHARLLFSPRPCHTLPRPADSPSDSASQVWFQTVEKLRQ